MLEASSSLFHEEESLTAPFTVQNLAERGSIHAKWLMPFEKLLRRIQLGHDRLKGNYTRRQVDLEGHLSFDLLLKGQEIVAFSGIYNGGRYANGVYRVLNRTYVAPAFRAGPNGYTNWNSRYILPAQLKRLGSQIDVMFVSRQGLAGREFLEAWTKRWAPCAGWSVSSDLFHVVPQSREWTAFHHVAQWSESGQAWSPAKLSREQWIEAYGR